MALCPRFACTVRKRPPEGPHKDANNIRSKTESSTTDGSTTECWEPGTPHNSPLHNHRHRSAVRTPPPPWGCACKPPFRWWTIIKKVVTKLRHPSKGWSLDEARVQQWASQGPVAKRAVGPGVRPLGSQEPTVCSSSTDGSTWAVAETTLRGCAAIKNTAMGGHPPAAHRQTTRHWVVQRQQWRPETQIFFWGWGRSGHSKRQSPLTTRHLRNLPESRIRAVQCYDCPTRRCGSGHDMQ